MAFRAAQDAVRLRVKDKRVLTLVKAFLKAGILTEGGQHRDTHTGTPQGGILSPLIFNIALSALDEHLHRDWKPGGRMDAQYPRRKRRRHGLPNWRIVRYADDFAILVHGSADDALALQDEVASVLEPLGLRLSPAKTRIVHMEDGFDFLDFRIQWKRKRGADKWYVYFFIADRPVRSVKDKIRALTRRTSQANPADVLIRLNQIVHGWTNYFRHAVAKHTFRTLGIFLWRRVIMWLKTLHRWSWKNVRKWLLGPHGVWLPITVDGVELTTRREHRQSRGIATGATPSPLHGRAPDEQPTATTVESPVLGNGYAGFGERPGETGRWQHRYRAPGRLNRGENFSLAVGQSISARTDIPLWSRWPTSLTTGTSAPERPVPHPCQQQPHQRRRCQCQQNRPNVHDLFHNWPNEQSHP
ncbi:reverse transcriptase domain-containing protein [Streptomyces sp. H10-C2]|uniref:group II intron maturase-specific domain-containing protein n=1 Tax=unclassified Streptomyces TaxID=2593676 RepID=UPI0024BB1304|nr:MULTISPECIES: group II intron maturase-specific domain-containing protein [unclassified Streptomyces]MDJ0346426.1 reverse transcriptase domain-containing protein [Streptomyces sp. PH10-H1]MDJ0374812.1 reverse transcriptase domain-containing protein [Streptomyces sp. H10-C2]